MKRDLLYRLTGRQGDFVNSLLNYGVVGNSAVANMPLRDWLGLTDRTTDAHVVALLAAATAYPEDSGIKDLHCSVSDLYPEALTVAGAQLVATGSSPINYCYAPTVFPFSTAWTLKYANAGEAILEMSAANIRRVSVQVLDATVSPAWPADTGMTANLKLADGWGPEVVINIHAPPRNYPFAAMVKALLQRSDAVALLASTGQAQGISVCRNPIRAAAMLVNALTR